jgi:hypothetical protein
MRKLHHRILSVSAASGLLAIDSRAVGGLVVALGILGAAYVVLRVPTRERVLAARRGAAP